MGANEKSGAAYHGYTPDTETVREQYTREQPPHIATVGEKQAEFDRWLDQVKREARAEALEDLRDDIRQRIRAAEEIPKEYRAHDMLDGLRIAESIMQIRAAQIREGS